MRDSRRTWCKTSVLPYVGQWQVRGRRDPEGAVPETAACARDAPGENGCAGASATAYGVACRNCKAGDSGLRSFVSVQGSLAMFPIHAFGSEDRRGQLLPRMTAGTAVGCFRADRGPTAAPTPATCRRGAASPAGDWV